MSAYDLDLAERTRLLRQDVIALRHALERTQQEKDALRHERDHALELLRNVKIEFEQRIHALLKAIREWK